MTIRRRGMVWSGRLWESTKWMPIKPKGNKAGLKMVKYGIALDRMRPHFVSLKPGRKITMWAEDKLGYKPKVLFVKPKHFIDPVIQRHSQKLKPMIQQEIRRIK